MLSEAKHPYWIDLTLSAGAGIPLLAKGRDKRVRLLSSPQQFKLSAKVVSLSAIQLYP
jgi:hypothetical protein